MKKGNAVLLLLLLSMLVSIPKISIVNAWRGVVYIRADGSVDPPTAPMQRDDNFYTLTDNITSDSSGIVIEKSNIVLEGAGYTLQGPGARREFSHGIYISKGSNVTVRNIQLKMFWIGIRLSNSSNNIFFGNNLTSHWFAIWLHESSSNSLSGNWITTVDFGIGLAYSSKNNISGNYIAGSSEYGITVEYFSNYNSIVGNNITNNGGGIGIDFHTAESSNNSIYHNYFMFNTVSVSVGHGSKHFWDDGYPSGGNYWSDYTGLDLHKGPYQNETGSDGIGDKPYVIDEHNQDRYPVVVPRTPASAPPVAKFFVHSLSMPIRAGEPLTFNASFSLLGWNGTHVMPITEYRWNFGDGNMTSTDDPVVIHSFALAKTHNVTLTVLDSEGLNSSYFQTVKVWMRTFVSISTGSSATYVGFAVDINGTLLDIYGHGLDNQTVVLHYTFAGANTWVPITSDATDQFGRYYVEWIPPATGYFTLKAGWVGNATHFAASNTVSLSIIPYQNEYVFAVESNSTISVLEFNSTSLELSFTVSGETGTRGYVKVTIVKSLISNIADVKVYIDGNQTEYSATSQDDAWTLTFTYTHSTHYVRVDLKTAIMTGRPFDPILICIMVAVIVIALISGIILVNRRKPKSEKRL